jgi:hypothetical protein
MNRVLSTIIILLALSATAMAWTVTPTELMKPTGHDPSKIKTQDLQLQAIMNVKGAAQGWLYIVGLTYSPRVIIAIQTPEQYQTDEKVMLIWTLEPDTVYRARWTYKITNQRIEKAPTGFKEMLYTEQQKKPMTLTLRIETTRVYDASSDGLNTTVRVLPNTLITIYHNSPAGYHTGDRCRIKSFWAPVSPTLFTLRSFLPLRNLDTERRQREVQ